MPEVAQLHRRLSAYYAAFYSVLGAMLPYFALWLAARGLSPVEIGAVLSVHGAMRIVMPIVWGWLADRWGRRMRLIQWATLLSLLSFIAVPLSQGFSGMVLSMMVFSVFWNATMPQFEAVTLHHLAETGGDYSHVRLWGSVGFVATVLGLGWLFDVVSINWLPWIILGLLAWMLLVAWRVQDPVGASSQALAEHSVWRTLRQPRVLALLLVCFLSQLSFAPYYAFFSLYLERHDYPPGQIGLLWAFGVVIEIWVFVYTGRMLRAYGAHSLMILAMASAALRWALLPVSVDFVPALLVLQALHLSSFGIFHACSMHYIARLFPGRLQGRGQALYVAVGFGVGGALGAGLAGQIWERQSPDALYYWAALAAFAGTLVAWRYLGETSAKARAVRAN